MKDGSVAFDRVVRQTLTEKIDVIVLAVCRIQGHPVPEKRIWVAIVRAELTRLAAAARTASPELDQDTFDRVARAIRDWRLHDRRMR